MAGVQSDGFNPDKVRPAPALGLTQRQVASDLSDGHARPGKAVWAVSEQIGTVVVETSANVPETKATDAARLRILMVDDDALILMNSVDMLEDMGHSVTAANSGAKALEILEADTMYDLLITDFSMPKMSGLQLALAVRALLPKLPVLLATGYAGLPVKSDLVLPQLLKPYTEAELQSAITEAVAQTGL